MTSRVSLVEQKKLQWAKEREEMARLNVRLEPPKHQPEIRTNIRTYPSITRLSSRETNGNSKNEPLRAVGHYGSTTSLRSLVGLVDHNNSSNTMTSLRTLDFTTGSLVNLLDGTDFPGSAKRRSPSLPPIYTKDHQQPSHPQESSDELGVDGARWNNQPRPQKHHYRRPERNLAGGHSVQHPYEEREGETSGYASDSVEAPVPSGTVVDRKRLESRMSERTWQNPYCETPETSLPPSRKLSAARLGDLNRPRWGSVWGPETGKNDPPPPSWLERGLCRLDNSSQLLVINHDSASSPDSSTTGSTGSDSKTYLRGQNIPVDAQVLQEREFRRQRALELQNAIKQQLADKERQRKAEKERRMREEREEEERIKRERDREKIRYEEEQRIIREKEFQKLKKEEAMRESLESAERKAKEEKKQKRRREESRRDEDTSAKPDFDETRWESPKNIGQPIRDASRPNSVQPIIDESFNDLPDEIFPIDDRSEKNCEIVKNDVKINSEKTEKNDCFRNSTTRNENTLRLPVGKEVAIVLSGRLEDTEFFNGTNLQLVNLVVSPSPRLNEKASVNANDGLEAFVKSLAGAGFCKKTTVTAVSPRIVENRILTPSKYRNFVGFSQGRDFGTQTDGESEMQDSGIKDNFAKDRKDVINNNRRDVEKSTNTGPSEEAILKPLGRSKSQPRTSLESRPRWNANRPGTRYRTQSEKDPHYQRRMRLRRRRVESSDDRSRSPSIDRRKFVNQKSKSRNSSRRKVKIDSYDADLSMDSLNSVLPLKIDEHGRINILRDNNKRRNKDRRSTEDENLRNDEKLDVWCGPEILSQLASLRNGLLSKQREWDPQRCLVSPSGDFY